MQRRDDDQDHQQDLQPVAQQHQQYDFFPGNFLAENPFNWDLISNLDSRQLAALVLFIAGVAALSNAGLNISEIAILVSLLNSISDSFQAINSTIEVARRYFAGQNQAAAIPAAAAPVDVPLPVDANEEYELMINSLIEIANDNFVEQDEVPAPIPAAAAPVDVPLLIDANSDYGLVLVNNAGARRFFAEQDRQRGERERQQAAQADVRREAPGYRPASDEVD